MSLARVSNNDDASDRRIPDFRADERAIQQYKTSLERRIKAYHSDQESAARRTFATKREALTAELAASEALIANRVSQAQEALAAYRQRYPHRLNKGRAVRPSSMEWFLSFGGATKLYKKVTDANSAVIEAQSNQRRLAHKIEQLESELARTLAQTMEKAKETTSSEAWLNDLHRDGAMRELKARVDEITAEREKYAKRLEAGRVSDEEQRDRWFAEHDVHALEVPLTGIMFYRVERFGPLVYLILRDIEKRLFALPYDPRLEPIIDGVFDIYRIADAYEVRQRVHEESKLPFTILDHFFVCNDRQDIAARAAYREQRGWMRAARTFEASRTESDLERDVITLLSDFATTIPSPRAPQII